MATLQDLRFVIDKADDVVGVVSATKLDGYALSMSVTVRPRGEQMLVRANAQYNLRAIEQPGPYQDFFAALDKGLFLEDNLLTAATESMPAASPAPAPPALASAVSVYDFYGEAEAEINAGDQDSDLWARALVETEGDEQKRKAKYIELRAAELFAQIDPRTVVAVNLPPARSEPANTGASAEMLANIRIEGTFMSTITNDSTLEYFVRPQNRELAITFEDDGKVIRGYNRSAEVEIVGTRIGNRIEFYIPAPNKITRFQQITGSWTISADGTRLEGDWKIRQKGAFGKWDLVRFDRGGGSSYRVSSSTSAASGLAQLAIADRLSGTYVSEITTNTHWVFQKRTHRELVIVFEQNGDQITGFSEAANLKISGTLSNGQITFFTWPSDITFSEIKGKWTVSDDGRHLEGRWTHPHGNGKWNLTRI